MLPLYKILYDKDAPRCSPEAEANIQTITKWFGEELFTYVRVFGSAASPHILPLYVPDKLLAREISYQTCGERGLTKDLKDKKKAIWPQFPVACGAFSLFDIGHVFKEVNNITRLQLFKFTARPFDPHNVAKNFTTAVKIKVFIKEADPFDDVFQQKSTLEEILNTAQTRFSPTEFQRFKTYREIRLANIPLEKLSLEPAREPTPSISLSESSDTGKSKSKSKKEISEHSKKSETNHGKREGSARDTAQSKDPEQQQVLTSQQEDPPIRIGQPPSDRTELDKEWQNFDDIINLEGQSVKTPEGNVQATEEMVKGTIDDISDMEHIPITPSSEVVLKI